MPLHYLTVAARTLNRIDRAVRQAELELIASRQRLHYRKNQLGRAAWRRLQRPGTPLYGFLAGLTLGLLPGRGTSLLPQLGNLGLKLYLLSDARDRS